MSLHNKHVNYQNTNANKINSKYSPAIQTYPPTHHQSQTTILQTHIGCQNSRKNQRVGIKKEIQGL